jgi:hypothetical protein
MVDFMTFFLPGIAAAVSRRLLSRKATESRGAL